MEYGKKTMKEIDVDEFQDLILENEDDAKGNIKFERDKIFVLTQDRSIEDLVNMFKRGKIIIPDYQRNSVWSKKQSSRFIDSLVEKIPIPSLIFFRNDDDGKLELIDGLQRVIAILNFVIGTNNETPSIGEINLKTITSTNGEKYNKMTEDDKFSFLEQQLVWTTFSKKSGSDEDLLEMKYKIFERINTGSDKLRPQEIRNALYNCSGLKKIINETKKDYFLNLVISDKKYIWNSNGKTGNRKHQDEFVIRLLSYNYWYNNNEKNSSNYSNKHEFMNFFMNEVKNEKILIDEEIKKFKIKLEKLYELDRNSFLGRKRNSNEISKSISEPFAESLFLYISKNDLNILKFQNTKTILNLKSKIYEGYSSNKDKDKYKCFFESTTNLKNVKERVEIIEEWMTI